MTAKELLTKLDAIEGTWADYDKEAIPLVECFRAEAKAEALREAADIAENILKNCPRDKYEGYMILPGIFRAAITQEPQDGN
jgi:uncharacterized protein YyaL (SSP411 family)